jgi:hypothetical protein
MAWETQHPLSRVPLEWSPAEFFAVRKLAREGATLAQLVELGFASSIKVMRTRLRRLKINHVDERARRS